MILKEFCPEFIPLDQIRFNRVHFSNLRLFGSQTRAELNERSENGRGGGRMAAAVEKLGVNICEPSEEWLRVVEDIANLSHSLRKVLRQL